MNQDKKLKIKMIVPSHPTGQVKIFGKVYMSPLTPSILAVHTPPHYEFKVTDENVEPIDFEEPVDLVALSVLTPMADRAYEIAKVYRQKGVKVVMGGVHPTLMPEEALEHSDAVVIGEAEGVWGKLLEDFSNGSLKKFYQSEAKPSLQNLPIPKWGVLKTDAYVYIPKVETSRGCPYNCSFCSTTRFFGRQIRRRPVEEVIKEIKKLSSRFVFFTDNNILGSPSYAKELFQSLIPLKIKWIGQVSINVVKQLEIMRLMAKSGCVGLLIGFESLAKRTLDEMNKKVNTLIEYKKAIKQIHSLGIGIIGCFVFGFDTDDESVFQRTLRFVKKMKIEVPQFTLLTPYPGTTLRQKLEEAGRLLQSKWQDYDTLHVVYQPVQFSTEELKKRYDKVCQKAYSWRAITTRNIKALFHLRSFYKFLVFWQINTVYRRLWLTSK
jgi:radical SAM superfamily enzyme YgiQ (UPF0313 family)